MSGRNRFFVSYDVSDPKRLRKIFKRMHGFGDAVQLSVFRCDLSRQEKALMIAALDELIHHQEDQVLIVDLGPAEGRGEDSIEVLGRPSPPLSTGPIIV